MHRHLLSPDVEQEWVSWPGLHCGPSPWERGSPAIVFLPLSTLTQRADLVLCCLLVVQGCRSFLYPDWHITITIQNPGMLINTFLSLGYVCKNIPRCKCGCQRAVCRSWFSSCCCVGPRDQTQAILFSGKCLFPQSHLLGPLVTVNSAAKDGGSDAGLSLHSLVAFQSPGMSAN